MFRDDTVIAFRYVYLDYQTHSSLRVCDKTLYPSAQHPTDDERTRVVRYITDEWIKRVYERVANSIRTYIPILYGAKPLVRPDQTAV